MSTFLDGLRMRGRPSRLTQPNTTMKAGSPIKLWPIRGPANWTSSFDSIDHGMWNTGSKILFEFKASFSHSDLIPLPRFVHFHIPIHNYS